jgi:hypothetical protein
MDANLIIIALVIWGGAMTILNAYQAKVISDAGIKNGANLAQIAHMIGGLYPADAIDKVLASERAKAEKTDYPGDDVALAIATGIAAQLKGLLKPTAETTETVTEAG